MFFFFFFNDTATTEIYTLSLHDALPICYGHQAGDLVIQTVAEHCRKQLRKVDLAARSEEHTSELQSPCNLVCRLLLEKKKKRLEEPGADRDDVEHTSLALTRVQAASRGQ